MPTIDLTLTITGVIALCAIISPSITALINNRYQLKLREMELAAEENKELHFYHRSIYKNYIQNTLRYIHSKDQKSMRAYSKSYSLALIYFPNELTESIVQINNDIFDNNSNTDDLLHSLNVLSKRIHDIIEIP